MTALIAGFSVGFSLILAIGAQNAFVLRQGLRRSHVFAVALTCSLSDALLIVLGVTSFSAISARLPQITPFMVWAGAAFLFVYGALRFQAAWIGGEQLNAAQEDAGSLKAAIATLLALTWLNPHVYLDTVVLIGSISTEYGTQASLLGLVQSSPLSSSFLVLLMAHGHWRRFSQDQQRGAFLMSVSVL